MTTQAPIPFDLPPRSMPDDGWETPADPNWDDVPDLIVEYDGLWGLIYDAEGDLHRVVDGPTARLG